MCGICGFTGIGNAMILKEMMSSLRHRGPNEEGIYSEERINLGHKRLSIIDLYTGRQPIFNEDKTVCLIFNGQIYNYKEIKKGLLERGHKFYTLTDTEVIVHLYEEIGQDFVNALNGEFAIALWDKNKSKLLLVRDRLGIRPLYYYLADSEIIFASEPKAILKHPGVNKELNNRALYSYFRLRYIAGQETMFEGIKKLAPATMLIYQNGNITIEKYWQLQFDADSSLTNQRLEEKFKELLFDSVKLRLASDVPIGFFISGGVDSATILALARKFITGEIKTFSVGFNTDIDEVQNARNLASLFSTNHCEFYIEKDAYKLLPKVIEYFDEPVGDAIILPTYLLTKEAKRSVKVALTGEGADEILGGYIHQIALQHSQILAYLPSWALKFCQSIFGVIPHTFLSNFFPYPAKLGKEGKNRILKYIVNSHNITNAYFTLTELFSLLQIKGLLSEEFHQECHAGYLEEDFRSLLDEQSKPTLNKVINLDLNRWLADYTLAKQDRLSMANSLEARVPYLDHRLAELSASLPLSLKISGNQTKRILRKTAADLLPKEFAYAKKRAFYIPTEKCFDADFNSFAKTVILEKDSGVRQIFSQKGLEKFIDSYCSQELVDNKKLLALVILKLWLRHYYC
jgi:asparagine synthase (glutamine-hydrolysing)